ncbi:MAG: SDR family oxidoreductase [Actinomycetota bacterium]|nr:MAG: SDR family oxidoreductase [Actinomycetota bacterium]
MTKPAELFDLTGRVAVVTGASSGLGVDMALTLRDAGATVVVAARRTELLADLCARETGLVALPCDLTDEESMTTFVQTVAKDVGPVDVLVNNAGMTVAERAENHTMADFRQVLEVNLIGLFRLTQLVGSQMLEARRGSIINNASILGIVAASPANASSYVASKGAVISLTRELAVQWARNNVRVNALAPGYVHTALTAELFEGENGPGFIERNTPMRRPGQSHELAGALLLLASDAGSYITGQTIVVDGGWTAR